MAHSIIHSRSQAKTFGGKWQDYVELNDWLDEPKYWVGVSTHRMFRHHSEGIQEAEQRFGKILINSDNKEVFVKYLCEQHIKEDCDGYIPSAKEWLKMITTGKRPSWMKKTIKIEKQGNIYGNTNQKSKKVKIDS